MKNVLEYFLHCVFTYPVSLISSNQNELIWTKLRQTMIINRDGYPLSCPGTCIVVKNVHCVWRNGPNSSFEVNHYGIISSCWHPSHLYPTISSFSVFIAKKRCSCTDEDAWRRYCRWMSVYGNGKRRDIAVQTFIFIECFNTWKFLLPISPSSNDNQLVFWNRIIEYK